MPPGAPEHSQGLAAGFKLETELQLGLIGSANQLEAVMVNVEKRHPRLANPHRCNPAQHKVKNPDPESQALSKP